MLRRSLIALAAALPLWGHAAYPEKSITLVQGFNAGGNADTIARIIAMALSKELGQSIVVEPKTGAGGNLASGFVSRAPADGYTLILMTGGHAVSAAMYKKLPFDPLESFDWVSLVTKFPFVISTSAQSRFMNLGQVVSAAKREPGAISFSSVGVGSTQHLSGELFQSLAGIRLNHIPYKGGSAPLQDLLGGRLDLMFDSVTVTKSQVDSGKLRALAVTSSQRAPQLPGVPPVAETIPGYEVTSWTGLAAPKGLPESVAKRLHGALLKVLADPEVGRQLSVTGGVPSPSASMAEMKSFVGDEMAKWKKVVSDAAIPQE